MASKKWLEEEKFVVKLLKTNHTNSEIQTCLKMMGYIRTTPSIRGFCKRNNLKTIRRALLDLESLKSKDYSKELVKAIEIMYETHRPSLDYSNNILDIPQAGKRRNVVPIREQFNLVRSHLKDMRDIIPIRPKIKPSMSDAESMVVCISDIQMGKVIKDVDGSEIYNINIAISRLEEMTSSILRVTRYAKKSTKIDELVLCLVGDLIENEIIYESQVHHIETFCTEQVKYTTKALWKMIISLREEFPKVRVETVRGNHGRTLGHVDSSWDNIIFQELQLMADVHNDSGITINTQYGEFSTFIVRGWKCLMRHDAPVQSSTAAAQAKYAGWLDLHKYDFMISAHFHHWQIKTYHSRPLFQNGSICGEDDLSERMAVGAEPVQLCFGVSQKRVPTFIYAIDLID